MRVFDAVSRGGAILTYERPALGRFTRSGMAPSHEVRPTVKARPRACAARVSGPSTTEQKVGNARNYLEQISGGRALSQLRESAVTLGRYVVSRILYHGTKGDVILAIIASGRMKGPNAAKLFFAEHRWDSALMHGADEQRKANFVIKIDVEIPPGAVTYRTQSPGVESTFVIESTSGIAAKVLELFVRKPSEEGFEFVHVVGVQPIRDYLTKA